MIDPYDASHDRLRLAVYRALARYDEEQLLDCLGDADPILRTTAARQLQLRGTRSSFEHVVALLDHPRFDKREIGAFALGQFGTPGRPFADETFALLPRLLDDPYVEVRRAAAGAVGALAMGDHQPPRHILTRLLDLARDTDAELRAQVAFALGMVDDAEALACLQGLRDDVDADVRDVAETSTGWHEERIATATAPGWRAAG